MINTPEPARRSYFFGPGYKQLAKTVKDAWSLNMDVHAHIWALAKRAYGQINKIPAALFIVRIPAYAVCFLAALFSDVSLMVFGSACTATVSAIHVSVIVTAMVVIYVAFSAVWVLDRTYLHISKMQSDCPACKTRSLIPAYTCKCGAIHKHLVPGVYGILYHRCDCGTRLPCAFFDGREKLNASCPVCGHDTHSGVRPTTIQLVGGTSSGKSVYLAALMQRLQSCFKRDASIVVTRDPESRFKDLDMCYNAGVSVSTTEDNAIMYSLKVEHKSLTPTRLLSIYDVRGEFFVNYAKSRQAQLQYSYCDGLVLLLDSIEFCTLEEIAKLDAEDRRSRSNVKALDVVTGLTEYMSSVKAPKRKHRFTVPLQVVLAKADILCGIIDDEFAKLDNENIREYQSLNGVATLEAARDQKCRAFLEERNGKALLNLINSNFETVQYFAISATGGPLRSGQPLAPWSGALLPILTVVKSADNVFYGLLDKLGGGN